MKPKKVGVSRQSKNKTQHKFRKPKVQAPRYSHGFKVGNKSIDNLLCIYPITSSCTRGKETYFYVNNKTILLVKGSTVSFLDANKIPSDVCSLFKNPNIKGKRFKL